MLTNWRAPSDLCEVWQKITLSSFNLLPTVDARLIVYSLKYSAPRINSSSKSEQNKIG